MKTRHKVALVVLNLDGPVAFPADPKAPSFVLTLIIRRPGAGVMWLEI
jgi:hypothetical protein